MFCCLPWHGPVCCASQISQYLCQFKYFVCPIEYSEELERMSMDCEPSPLFQPTEYGFPGWIAAVCNLVGWLLLWFYLYPLLCLLFASPTGYSVPGYKVSTRIHCQCFLELGKYLSWTWEEAAHSFDSSDQCSVAQPPHILLHFTVPFSFSFSVCKLWLFLFFSKIFVGVLHDLYVNLKRNFSCTDMGTWWKPLPYLQQLSGP